MLSRTNCLPNHGKPVSQFNYDNMMYGNIAHYHSQDKYANVMHRKQGYCNKAIPRYHSTKELNHRYESPAVSRRNLQCNQQSQFHKNNDISLVALTKAIRRAHFERSLFPHGDPMPEDWIDSWYERPECPRPKWTYPENPPWRPPIENQTGEYSGTELIQARSDDVLTTSFVKLNDLYTNIRSQIWQVVSTEDVKDTTNATNVTSDYGTCDSNSSDSSSNKSGSSADLSPRKFFAALW